MGTLLSTWRPELKLLPHLPIYIKIFSTESNKLQFFLIKRKVLITNLCLQQCSWSLWPSIDIHRGSGIKTVHIACFQTQTLTLFWSTPTVSKTNMLNIQGNVQEVCPYQLGLRVRIVPFFFFYTHSISTVGSNEN